MLNRKHFEILASVVTTLLVLFKADGLRAQQPEQKAAPVPGAMLRQGTVDFDTPEFTLKLVRSSQTVAALVSKGSENFDFTPGDLLVERSQDGYYHLGDLDLRLRLGTSGEWKGYSTSLVRTPVLPLSAAAPLLASADLAPTLPADIPLQATRAWLVKDGELVLSFTLRNKSSQAVEIGALGIPMVFNNVLNGRSLDQAHALCSFYDPYIGENAGYLQVTRLNGHGPALLVVPDGNTPFEAYNPILGVRVREGKATLFHDLTPRGVTFEGFYDWMVHSRSFAEDEWKNAQPWNPATSRVLAPGESVTYGLRFLRSDSIRDIEKTLSANARPVAVGVPGYVLPTDQDGRLFLNYRKNVKSMTTEPQDALAIAPEGSTPGGWKKYAIRGKRWGRARLTITYDDGLVQMIHYFVTKPQEQVLRDLGHFLTTSQWFDDPRDPFGRSPSVMTYDREADQIVKQDSRVWIAGLGDEGGAGSWLTAALKEWGEPDKQELEKYEQFVDEVLWGRLQYRDGPSKNGVRKSLFYYQPDELPPNYYRSDLNWKSWTSWNKQDSARTDRSFDYPHVAVAYWVLYRLARNHSGLVTRHPWDWYLAHAYDTSVAMVQFAAGYAEFGQMEGDIFVLILEDLKREGLKSQAEDLEAKMRARADHWKAQAFPFGSEMPWDSTGQEEVFAWMKYFGYKDKAQVTLDAILGYDPTLPHWGYNGSARRYWDFVYAGKYARIERQLHHYGSGINAIPVLATYRENPDDFYLLRVGYGGTLGALTNIDQEGFASAAFHSFPDMLKFDPYTADYGPNFFGHAVNTGTYVVQHPEFAWLAFGGNIDAHKGVVRVTPLDSFRSRVYLAPLGLWLTLDSGEFQRIEIDTATHKVQIELAPATPFTTLARLRIEQPFRPAGIGVFRPSPSLQMERGAYAVLLQSATTAVELLPSKD
jgi:hypothetical protein